MIGATRDPGLAPLWVGGGHRDHAFVTAIPPLGATNLRYSDARQDARIPCRGYPEE